MYHVQELYLSQGFAGRRPIGHAILLTLQLVSLIFVFFPLINVLYNVNLYILFAIFWFMLLFSYFVFHINIVYECIVLRCTVENKLTHLLTYG